MRAKLQTLAQNRIGLIPLENFHISLGRPDEQTWADHGKSEFSVTLNKDEDFYFFGVDQFVNDKRLHPIIRGNQDRKSKAIQISGPFVYRLIHEINAANDVHLGFEEPLNGGIKPHISLANLTGKPRHSLKDPFSYKGRWVGVDLDGTLAIRSPERYTGEIGDVIPPIRDLIFDYINDGLEVKIFTARVAQECSVTGRSINQIKELIQDWLQANNLPRLEITCIKDRHCILIYDDKAITVTENTGEYNIVDRIIEKYEAALFAESRNSDASREEVNRIIDKYNND